MTYVIYNVNKIIPDNSIFAVFIMDIAMMLVRPMAIERIKKQFLVDYGHTHNTRAVLSGVGRFIK